MHGFAETCESVAKTTKKNEKVRLVSEYLRSLPVDDAARAAIFFTGRPFPRLEERILGVGGSVISKAVGRLTAASAESFETVYRKHGDLGSMIEEIFRNDGKQATAAAKLSLGDLEAAFEALSATRGSSQKRPCLDGLSSPVGRGGAKQALDPRHPR